MTRTALTTALALVLVASCAPPPPNHGADYQLGGDYPPAAGVTVVVRDWFSGQPLTGGDTYSICYVNAFQTQADEPDVDRPDERSNWPQNLVLSDLGDDPNWGGEYLIDISTAAKRSQATSWVIPMVQACADAGFDAVEFDNLDSWTRFDDTALAGQVPFAKAEAVDYARRLVSAAHARGLAAAQKNTPQLTESESLETIRFDFAIAEECGFYEECGDYSSVYGNNIIAIEYTAVGFNRACATFGDSVSVVRRDVSLSVPGSPNYVYQFC